MSQENVETVLRVAEALRHRDVAGIVAEVDPEVEWHPAMQALVGGDATVYRGPEGVREMMHDFYDTFADVQLEVLETREAGDRVVLIGHLHVRGKVSGVDADSPAAYVVSFSNGKLIRVRTYLDPNEALEAVGLSE
jgi:ketosteroid isomerase-like protein